MIETTKINSKNIDSLVRYMKRIKRQAKKESWPQFVIVPKPQNVLSNRYRGKGRPRKSDYDYVDFLKLLKNKSSCLN